MHCATNLETMALQGVKAVLHPNCVAMLEGPAMSQQGPATAGSCECKEGCTGGNSNVSCKVMIECVNGAAVACGVRNIDVCSNRASCFGARDVEGDER